MKQNLLLIAIGASFIITECKVLSIKEEQNNQKKEQQLKQKFPAIENSALAIENSNLEIAQQKKSILTYLNDVVKNQGYLLAITKDYNSMLEDLMQFMIDTKPTYKQLVNRITPKNYPKVLSLNRSKKIK